MSVNYELTIAGADDYQAVAKRAFPEAYDLLKPDPDGHREGLDGDFNNVHGFAVSVTKYERGYVDADSGAGQWIWEPGRCVIVTFYVEKSQLHRAAVAATQAVSRVLATGQEDLAYVLTYDTLLLTRLNGVVHKYAQQDFWSAYDELNAIVAS